MVGDCRSLIEFCKSFEHHRNMATGTPSVDPQTQKCSFFGRSKKQLSHASPVCENLPTAVIDVIILIVVLVACFFLLRPYFSYICSQAAHVLPPAVALIGEVLCEAPIAYISGTLLTFVSVIGGWEFYQIKLRKCGKPKCRGLKKAVEFDIQLESEGFVKSTSSPPSPAGMHNLPWIKEGIDLGEEHKELEAELRRMAPLNGRAVLVFRSPCGCPRARMEVWGAKKPRKSKK